MKWEKDRSRSKGQYPPADATRSSVCFHKAAQEAVLWVLFIAMMLSGKAEDRKRTSLLTSSFELDSVLVLDQVLVGGTQASHLNSP